MDILGGLTSAIQKKATDYVGNTVSSVLGGAGSSLGLPVGGSMIPIPSLSNNEALDSRVAQGDVYNQRISGIQGALNVPAFPFTMTGESGVTADFSSLGDVVSNVNPLVLAALGVVLLLVVKGA